MAESSLIKDTALVTVVVVLLKENMRIIHYVLVEYISDK